MKCGSTERTVMNPNRKNKYTSGLLPVLLLITAVNAADQPVIEIGHKYTLPSNHLGEPVDLIVHLPAAYTTQDASYPLLLLLGSNYRARFTLAASTLDYMHGQGQLPAIILVGMDLPHGNFGMVPQEGADGTASADRYVAALTEEVIPYIDKQFHTNGYRILYGGSNCGIFAVYALMQGRLPAQAVIASSPMLGWSPDLVVAQTREAFAATERPDRFLFLIASDDDYSRVTHEFPGYVHLLETSAPAWLHWKAEIRKNEGHVPEGDLAWGLRALFPDYNPTTELKTLSALQEHYAALSRRYGFTIEVPPYLLFDLGFDLAFADELEEAQRIFAFAVKRHPRQARSYAGFGLVHQRRGDTAAAVTLFEKALALDPEQGLAKRLLAEIQSKKAD